MTIQMIKKKAIPVFKRQGVTKAAVFGSVARNEMNKRSDIDFVVNLKKNKNLLDLVGLKLDLEETFGKKVDVLTYRSIHPLLKSRILNEQKIIYEERS